MSSKTVKNLGSDLKEISKGDTQHTLSVANGIFVDSGTNILDTFKTALSKNYGANSQMVRYLQCLHVLQVNFSTDPETSRKTINTWVSNATKEKIQELLKEGSISTLTRLVLANAVYFKGIVVQD